MSKPGNPNTVHVKYRKIHTSDLKYDEKVSIEQCTVTTDWPTI